MSGKLAGLILAGGASRRMGSPKALLDWGGETVVDSLIGKLAEVCEPVVVVLGHEAERIGGGIAKIDQVRIVVNAAPERGQMSSMQCGLRELGGADGVMFTPVDCPAVRGETVKMLAEKFWDGGAIVVPRYKGRRGHPVIVPGRLIGEFLEETGTARDVLRRHEGETVYCDVEDAGIAGDMDTPEEYERLKG